MSDLRRALLLVAHGSRVAEANAEVARLADRVRKDAKDYSVVSHAFLEIAEPDIPAGIDMCVEQGAEEVVVVPYFLAEGRHVREDIPALVEAARLRHEAVRIVLRPHIGASPEIPGFVLQLAQ